MKKLLLLVLLLVLGTANAASVVGSTYRVVQTNICNDGIYQSSTYDLEINKDTSWSSTGVGAYHFDISTSQSDGYVTFTFSCTGTWVKTGRNFTFSGQVCTVDDAANYVDGTTIPATPENSGTARSLVNQYLNYPNTSSAQFAPGGNNFIAYQDPATIEALTINGATSERVCNRQGHGVRLRPKDVVVPLPAITTIDPAP